MAAASWNYEELGDKLFNYIDIDPSLNGSDLGQIVFDKNTQLLSKMFSCEGVKVYTGIGYVVTQAIQYLPSELVPGTYHEEYNRDPATGPKKKVYIGKYNLDDYFSSKEFTKYPDCTHIIIVDWNKKAIQILMDIIEAVPDVFESKKITIVHGDIKSKRTIRTLSEIAERDYKLPITGMYVTNIVDTFTPKDIALFSELSSENVQLRCDTMRIQGFEQMIVNTVGDHKPIYIRDSGVNHTSESQEMEDLTQPNSPPQQTESIEDVQERDFDVIKTSSVGAAVSPTQRRRPEKRDETRISHAPYGGARQTKRTYRKKSKRKSFHKMYAKCILYHRLKSKKNKK
jgi:hypothetical protein